MHPKSMVLIVIALVCGLVASIGISQVVERNSANKTEQVQTQAIFVAMTDLGIGTQLNANCVKLEEWPVDKIPVGAITEANQMDGKRPSQRLFAGEPLLLAKLADENTLKVHSHTIKKGYRVMSVKVDMASAVSGLMNPGDRVDVLALSGPRTAAEMILANVEVFAINDQTHQEVDAEGGTVQAKTVSLLVTSDQARKLMAASYKSTISLSLRRPDDDTGLDDDLVETEPTKSISMPDLRQMMPSMPVGPPKEEYTMDVLEGGNSGEVHRYTFDDRDSLPRELSPSGGGMNNTPPASDFPFPTEEQDTGSPVGGPVKTPANGPAQASARGVPSR